jgi:phytoene dehydrogenase-like protein
MDRYDVIIIGAGINGLISAAYLAKAGKSVIVLRSVGKTGGDYSSGWKGADGFVFPTSVSRLENLPTQIVHDLDLEAHGLRQGRFSTSAVVSSLHGALVRDTDQMDMKRRLTQMSSGDADAWTDYIALITRQRRHLENYLELRGGALPGRRDLLTVLASAGQDGMWEAVHLYASSAREVLEQRFESDALKTLLFASTLGGYFSGMGLGPAAPTSGAGLVMDPMSVRPEARGALCGPVEGGGEALMASVEKAARSFGATFVDDVDISEIVHDKGAIKGLALDGGQFIETPVVIGDVDVKVLFLSMFAWKALPHDLVLNVASSRSRAQIAQINFVLDGEPDIEGLPEGFLGGGGTLHMLDDMEQAERACDAWITHTIPDNPPFDFRVHGTRNTSGSAEGGRSYATATLYYIPGDLADGEWTDAHRIQLISTVVNKLVCVSPGFEKRLVDAKLVLPVDYEERFGLVGGELHGGNTGLDQALFNRPNPQLSAGDMPIKGLYLAGPGTAEAPFTDGRDGWSIAERILQQGGGLTGQGLAARWSRALAIRMGLAS